MKRILVTGGCGFIGSHVVDELLRQGQNVLVMDKLTYAGRRENLPAKHQSFFHWNEIEESNVPCAFVEADICEPNHVDELVAGCSSIINLAAETHVDRSYRETRRFIKANVMGTFELLEAARSQDKRMLHVSTDEIYGHQSEGFVQENEKLAPRNPYSVFKASADMMVQTYQACFDVDTVIVRPANNFGPRQYPEKLIPRTILCCLKSEKMPIHGDGQHVRDWLWVKDCAKAIVLAYEKSESGGIYNIAAHSYVKVVDVVQAICERLEKDPSDVMEFIPDRVHSDKRYAMDSSRMQALGWKPTVHFEEGLDVVVDWYARRFEKMETEGSTTYDKEKIQTSTVAVE